MVSVRFVTFKLIMKMIDGDWGSMWRYRIYRENRLFGMLISVISEYIIGRVIAIVGFWSIRRVALFGRVRFMFIMAEGSGVDLRGNGYSG